MVIIVTSDCTEKRAKRYFKQILKINYNYSPGVYMVAVSKKSMFTPIEYTIKPILL